MSYPFVLFKFLAKRKKKGKSPIWKPAQYKATMMDRSSKPPLLAY
jgi:hypothetical protein